MNSLDIALLSENLGITFNDTHIIRNAFVHRSYLNESNEFNESNERLEYLGDAVLELATTEYLFKNYPQYQEGMLTNLRSALVKTTTLSDLAIELGLPRHILMSRGEEETGGRSNQSILADTMEAFIGALYLDQGFDTVKNLLQKHLFPKTKDIIANSTYKDSKSILQELAQAKLKATPEYELVSETGPDHNKTFVMRVLINKKPYASGSGRSKQQAQEEAAKHTIEMIRNN